MKKKEGHLDWRPSQEVATLSSEEMCPAFTLNNLSFRMFSSEVYKTFLGSGLQKLPGSS